VSSDEEEEKKMKAKGVNVEYEYDGKGNLVVKKKSSNFTDFYNKDSNTFDDNDKKIMD
jgi:hypothetical protein